MAPVDSYDDPTHRGAVAMGLLVAHNLGAVVALSAIDAGASLEVAFTIAKRMPAHAAELVEMHLTSLGIETEAMRYIPEALATPNWKMLAREAGVPCDFKAWQAYADAHSAEVAA